MLQFLFLRWTKFFHYTSWLVFIISILHIAIRRRNIFLHYTTCYPFLISTLKLPHQFSLWTINLCSATFLDINKHLILLCILWFLKPLWFFSKLAMKSIFNNMAIQRLYSLLNNFSKLSKLASLHGRINIFSDSSTAATEFWARTSHFGYCVDCVTSSQITLTLVKSTHHTNIYDKSYKLKHQCSVAHSKL